LPNFVGCVVGFLNTSPCIPLWRGTKGEVACGASSLPPRYALNATWYKGDFKPNKTKRKCCMDWREEYKNKELPISGIRQDGNGARR
jgi:hypothetical protein